jgi:hypothetical protein
MWSRWNALPIRFSNELKVRILYWVLELEHYTYLHSSIVRDHNINNISAGWYFSPISTSMKITFFFGILFGLICYIAYSAALVSILSVEVVPIRSFGDLLTEEFMITSDSHIPTAKVVVQVYIKMLLYSCYFSQFSMFQCSPGPGRLGKDPEAGRRRA